MHYVPLNEYFNKLHHMCTDNKREYLNNIFTCIEFSEDIVCACAHACTHTNTHTYTNTHIRWLPSGYRYL